MQHKNCVTHKQALGWSSVDAEILLFLLPVVVNAALFLFDKAAEEEKKQHSVIMSKALTHLFTPAFNNLKHRRHRNADVSWLHFFSVCSLTSVKSKDGFIIGCSKKCCKKEATWFHMNLEFHVKFSVCLATLEHFPFYLFIFFCYGFWVSLWERFCVAWVCVVNNLCSRGLWMGGCFNDLMGHSKDSFHWEPWRLSERYEAIL